MKKKSKKAPVHYHMCGDHKWKHEGTRESCSLSNHTHCGFQYANDYNFCVKGKPLFKREPTDPAVTLKKFIGRRISGKITEGKFFSEAGAFGIERNVAEGVLLDEVKRRDERQFNKLRVFGRRLVKGKINKSVYFDEAFRLRVAEDQAANILRDLTKAKKGGKVKA